MSNPAAPPPTALFLDKLFSTRAQQIGPEQIWPEGPSQAISLAYGFADPEMFPIEALQAANAEVLSEDTDGALNYGRSFAGLTQLVAHRLNNQNINVNTDQVLISYGSSEILSLLPEVLVNPGDVVIVEGPTFMGAVKNFLIGGAKLVTVPVDEDGMDVDALEEILRDHRARGVQPKFIYSIPTFQNPSGSDMTLERRKRLVQLAAEYEVLVVEDDAYGELRFRGTPLPRLAALDTQGCVLHVGTFSKIIAPGLRMGWAAGPKNLIDRLSYFRAAGASGPYITRLVERFAAEGRLDEHIRALNVNYERKRDLMLTTMQAELPDDITAPVPHGGFFIWAKLPPDIQAMPLAMKAAQMGVTIVPGNTFFANGQGHDYVRLAFSYQSDANLVEGIKRLGQTVRAMRAG